MRAGGLRGILFLLDACLLASCSFDPSGIPVIAEDKRAISRDGTTGSVDSRITFLQDSGPADCDARRPAPDSRPPLKPDQRPPADTRPPLDRTVRPPDRAPVLDKPPMPDACKPDCWGKMCGGADGCGGKCHGPCAATGHTCVNKVCECGPSPAYKMQGGVCKPACGTFLLNQNASKWPWISGCCTGHCDSCAEVKSSQWQTYDCEFCCARYNDNDVC